MLFVFSGCKSSVCCTHAGCVSFVFSLRYIARRLVLTFMIGHVCDGAWCTSTAMFKMHTLIKRAPAASEVVSRNASSAPPTVGYRRVVANGRQLVLLNQLYQRTGEHASKEDVANTARETGLEERWVKKWVQRQRKSRARKSTGTASTVSSADNSLCLEAPCAPTSSVTTVSDPASSTSAVPRNERLTPTVSRQPRPFIQYQPAPSGYSPIQVTRPGASFTVPLRPVFSSEDADTQPLAVSPAGSRHTIQNAYSWLPSQDAQPSVPAAFPVPPAQTELTQSASSLYLSQLLLESGHSIPYAVLSSEPPQYFSGCSPPLASRASSVPSLQPHSVSVLGGVHFPPPPVAFKMRFADLVALMKRIRTTFEEKLMAAMTGSEDVPWDTDLYIESRMLRLSAASTADYGFPAEGAEVRADACLGEEETEDDEDEVVTPGGELEMFFGDSMEDLSKGKAKMRIHDAVYERGVGLVGGVLGL
ncbi:hypothetical protein B0H21DRAFT_206122 [Amylocystis lapponica]|nr:hypothetical protein B0H21DRAFT_206122 [Amylocystis lapponica]